MGRRANYFLIEAGKVDVRFANWGGPSLPRDLFFGPEVAAALFRAHEPATHLLDEVFCEGAALLDFGWHLIDDPVVRAHHEALLREAYQGWTVLARYEALVEIHQYLGWDPEPIRVNLDLNPTWPTAEPESTRSAAEALDAIEEYLLSAEKCGGAVEDPWKEGEIRRRIAAFRGSYAANS